MFGDWSVEDKSFRKLAFGVIEQCCADALALHVGRDEKLIEQMVLRDYRKQTRDMPSTTATIRLQPAARLPMILPIRLSGWSRRGAPPSMDLAPACQDRKSVV